MVVVFWFIAGHVQERMERDKGMLFHSFLYKHPDMAIPGLSVLARVLMQFHHRGAA